MLYGKIERELAEVEPGSVGQQTSLPPHLQRLAEQEQFTQDIYDEALLRHVEHVRRSQQNCSGITRTTASCLYQLVSHYLRLPLGR